MRPKNSHRKPLALGVTRLEDRTVPAGTITVTAGANGSGSLDAFLFDSTPGVVTTADGGTNPGTLSAGALAAVGATVDINVAAQNGITFNDLGGTLTLQTASGHSVIFSASGGALTVANPANTLATSGAGLNLIGATGLSVFNVSSGGASVMLTGGGAGDIVARSILTGGTGAVFVQISNSGTGRIFQSGSVVGGAVNFTGRGNVSVDDLRGTSVSVTSINGAISSAGGKAIQSTGQLTLRAATGITVNTLAAGIQAQNLGSGNISITQTATLARAVITAGTGIDNAASGGSVTVTNLGSTITVSGGAPVHSTSGPIALAALDLNIVGTVNSGTARTTLGSSTAGRPIDLGTNTGGRIGLTHAELNNVTAAVLQVGGASAGDIGISASVGPFAGVNTLALITNGSITESANSLTVLNLRVNSPQVALTGPNNVGTVAAAVSGGSFILDNNAPLVIGTVDGVTGVATNGGGVVLVADSLDAQQAINAVSGSVQISPFTSGRQMSLGSEVSGQLSLTDTELGQLTGGILRVGTASGGTGAIAVNGAITRHAGYNTLSLATNGTVTQTAALSVANLAVQSAGAVLLTNADNDVDTVAATVTGSGNGFSYTDVNSLAVGIVDGLSGITTNSGPVALVVGRDITDGNGTATNVTAASLSATAANIIDLDTAVLTISAAVAGAKTGGISLTNTSNSGVTGVSSLNAGIGAITLDGGTFRLLSDNAIAGSTQLIVTGATLDLGSFSPTVAGVTLTGGSIIGTGTLSSATAFDLRNGSVSGGLGGTAGVTKTTGGTVTLSGANTWTGTTAVNNGTLLVNGSLAAGGLVQVNGGTLGGNGTIGAVTASFGEIAPGTSPGLLTANSNVSLGSSAAFVVELNGTTAGTNYDQLRVNGTVSLGGGPLRLLVGSGFVPTVGTQFVLIDNDGADPVAGTFAGLYEGASLLAAGQRFTISYSGGTGNDVVLTKARVAIQSVTIDDGTAQRSVVRSITVTLDGQATFAGLPSSAFQLTRTGPGGPNGLVTLAVDTSGSTANQTVARLTFQGALTEGANSLIDGNYTLTVFSGQVQGGIQGGDSVSGLHRLFGDVNGDKAVNGLDLTAWRGAFGSVSTDAGYNPSFDFNGDGAINGTDLTQFRNRFGVILP